MSGYVLVKGKAGLGNRMLSAMTGVLYAMLSQRNLVVDWSDSTYSDDGQNVFPKLFKVPNSEAQLPVSAYELCETIAVEGSVEPTGSRGD